MGQRSCREAAPSRWVAKARAALIALLVFFNALAALPTPGEASLERLQRPFEQAELRRWVRLLRGLGVSTDPERLARGYFQFSQRVERARAVALSPIEGWMSLTLTHQRWRLFGTPDRTVSALRVTAHSARGDEVLYQSGDAERRWSAALFEYRRVRAAYNPTRRGPPRTYAAFCERVSAEVFATLPHVSRVSVALVEKRVGLPSELPPRWSGNAGAGASEQLRHVVELARPGE